MDVTKCYKSFSKVQTIALWAGALGLVQSLIWMGLSIVSILAYCCILDLGNLITYGSITKLVFFEMYFRGDCEPDVYPDFTVLKTVDTVFDSAQILIWTCVYLGLSLAWFIVSCLLLSHVKKDNLKMSSNIMYSWATITLITCCMDLSIGIIFSIDYSRFQWEAYNYNLSGAQAGTINPDAVELVAAQIAAISMMILSLKGFVMWIINLGLLIYVYIGGYVLQHAVLSQDETLNFSFSSTTVTRDPINAFDSKNEVVFENAGFVVEQRNSPVELNEESINRAAHLSTNNLQERRFRNIDSFQQYPPPRQQLPQQQPQQQQQQQIMAPNEPPFPAPDYTPPMPRANQNGQLRNTRYQ